MQNNSIGYDHPALAVQVANPAITNVFAFSNAIASVHDGNVLGKIIGQQLNKLFLIEDYIIFAINDNKTSCRPVVYDHCAAFAKHPDFLKLVHAETRFDSRVFGPILNIGCPVTFDADQWFRSRSPVSGPDRARPVGLMQMTGIPLRLGEENIAIMLYRQADGCQVDFLKPFFRSVCSQISLAISNMIAREKADALLNEINIYRQQQAADKCDPVKQIKSAPYRSEIVGRSPEMLLTFQLVAQVAPSDSTVLLLGETGTGKELIARAIHDASIRKENPMVKVNCAALPANLIESELFGHEKGSFTGAIERRIGKFELADKGTLFLDEIGEMPLDLQVKLLRALQEREIERVGGKNTIKVDVRIIAATNRDLEAEMKAGRFRKDLFYRLNIFPISLPPLRERKQDIPALATYFIERFAKKAGKNINTLSNKAFQELIDYPWPGNIRELEHLIERSVLLCTGNTIKQIPLPAKKRDAELTLDQGKILLKTIDENERDHILSILKYCKGRVSGAGGAAEILGVPPSTLNSKVKKLGIRKEHSL